MNRRAFLCALGAAGAAVAAPAQAASLLPKDAGGVDEPLATLFDLSNCVGCGACVDACREVHEGRYPEPRKPFPKMRPSRVKVEDFSDKRDLTDRLTPYNYLFIQTVTVEKDGRALELNIPRRCMHCQHPPCVELCPWGSAMKYPDGAVVIDDSICLGGAKCRKVCPWKIPQRQTGVGLYLDLAPAYAGNGVMYKCDRCHERVAAGELPACVEACPNEVQTIGPRSQILLQARELAEKTGGYVYGAVENGGTNTIYVSPVPFEEIDKAIDKGPGKPGMGKVADAMADEANLASAVFLAPVAGVAAGILKLAGAFRKKDETKEDDHA